jgi:hypothetical protein
VLDRDWAYELGSAVLWYDPPGEPTQRKLTETYLLLLHRTPEGWKIHREVASGSQLPDAQ